ncbi:hypothetical protein LguiB_010976 [Lonicera macranthoides]
MRKIRGFILKNRVTRFTKIFRYLLRRHRSPATYGRLEPVQPKPISNIFNWALQLKTKAKSICWKNPGPGYLPIGQEPTGEEFGSVPKGKMAVYVGQKDGDYKRVIVPVIYINHPLFGKLLREAEEVYGFNHPGGITIPCRISEFERVKTRIQAGSSGRKMLTWK